MEISEDSTQMKSNVTEDLLLRSGSELDDNANNNQSEPPNAEDSVSKGPVECGRVGDIPCQPVGDSDDATPTPPPPQSAQENLLAGLLTDDAEVEEVWEKKAEQEKAERAHDIVDSLTAAGLSEEEVAQLIGADLPEAWEVKVEKEQEEKDEEVKMVMETLGLSPADLQLSEDSLGVEAWERKAVKEKEFLAEDDALTPSEKKSFFSWLFGSRKRSAVI